MFKNLHTGILTGFRDGEDCRSDVGADGGRFWRLLCVSGFSVSREDHVHLGSELILPESI